MAELEIGPTTIVEEREEVMIDPTVTLPHQTPSLRIAHFLKPTLPLTSTLPNLPKIQSFSLSSKPNVVFIGRQPPLDGWETWVDKLQSTHGPAWRKAGIFDAIKASTYHIPKQDELVLRLAERWCPETNTFVLPWGEVTVTLEDVMVLGGFSTLGDSVLSECSLGQKVEQVESNLVKFIRKFRAKNTNAAHSRWQNRFMGSGDELEHAAFLALWLSRHVFQTKSQYVIHQSVFSLAARLSNGVKVALAPAVLASIYRDFTLLKNRIVSLSSGEFYLYDDPLVLLAQFQLVQVWAWERFPVLAPIPRVIGPGEPRLSRWANLNMLKVGSFGIALDSARESFHWRPYAASIANWPVPSLYGDTGKWVNVASEVESESFARCLRVCQLVGMDCEETYQPHRVAMQFGLDQDVPSPIPGLGEFRETSWRSYDSPFLSGMMVYVPPRLFEADVSVRYSDWCSSQSFLQEANDFQVYRRRNLMTVADDCEVPVSRLSARRLGNHATAVPSPNKKHQLTGPLFEIKVKYNFEMRKRSRMGQGSASSIDNEQDSETVLNKAILKRNYREFATSIDSEQEEEFCAEESSEIVIFEEREELMIDPNGAADQTPNLRTAHFIKPSLNPISLPPLPPKIQSFDPSSTPPKVIFNGSLPPNKGWQTWVEKLQPTHESVWRKAGIFDAIKASTYHITRDDELVLGLAERWCPETNTFVFPWGEATITLEDVMILGGFSILGDSILSAVSLGQTVTQVVRILKNEFKKIRLNASCTNWQKHFIEGGWSADVEHAAFLALWLSRHVFPSKSKGRITQSVFSLAAILSCGTKVALAPTILASIYGELTFLKEEIVCFSGGVCDNDSPLVLLALFQLVQLWAWERFSKLAPIPRMIKHGYPRMSRWERRPVHQINDLGEALDSARQTFHWRPYFASVQNWSIPNVYVNAEMSECDGFDEDIESFARCLRVCTLPGMENVQVYLPHRVAMQFGFDQDIPCSIPKSYKSVKSAWIDYNKEMTGAKLYLPPQSYKAKITSRYSDWWNRKSFSIGVPTEHKLPDDEGSKKKDEASVQNFNKMEDNPNSPDDEGFKKKDEASVQNSDKMEDNPNSPCLILPTSAVKDVRDLNIGIGLLNQSESIISSDEVVQVLETTDDGEEEDQNLSLFESFCKELEVKISELETTVSSLLAVKRRRIKALPIHPA